MKPLEYIFFISCCRACSFKSYWTHSKYSEIKKIVSLFVSLGFSKKQLIYYIEKWSVKGFYNYGVNILFGWFEFEKLTGEYETVYKEEKRNINI